MTQNQVDRCGCCGVEMDARPNDELWIEVSVASFNATRVKLPKHYSLCNPCYQRIAQVIEAVIQIPARQV
jgi:hypothetical protein